MDKITLVILFILAAFHSYGQKWALDSSHSIQLSYKSNDLSYKSFYDFSGDGITDIVSVSDSIDLVTFRNGTLEHHDFLFQPNLETTGSVFADIDADGKMDLIVGSYWSNRFSIYRGIDKDKFSTPVHYNLDGHCNGLSVGYIDDDEYPDIVAIRNGSAQPIAIHVFLNKQDGTFERVYFHNAGDDTNTELHIKDLNNDGKNDILIRSINGFILTYLQNQPNDFTFHYIPIMPIIPGTPFTFPGGTSMASMDFDLDKLDDLVITYFDSLIIRKGLGDGSFAEKSMVHYDEITLTNIVVTNLNGDDNLDIIGIKLDRSEFKMTDSLFILQYNPIVNSIVKMNALKLPGKPRSIFNSINAADFTGDDIIDLAVSCEGDILTILQGKIIESVLSLPDEKKSTVRLYPNPTSGKVYLDIKTMQGKNFDILVYTLAGKLILQQHFSAVEASELEFDVSSTEKILLLRLISEDSNFTETILLK